MQTGNQGEALGCCVSQRPMAKGQWLSYLSVFISITCPGLPWISGKFFISDHPITRSPDLLNNFRSPQSCNLFLRIPDVAQHFIGVFAQSWCAMPDPARRR